MNGSYQPDSLEDTINFGKNTHTQNKANLKTWESYQKHTNTGLESTHWASFLAS